MLEEKKLVIFHRDKLYSERLMNFCNREKTGGFSAVSFAERPLMEEYLKNNPSSVLLCEENTSDISKLQAACRKLFILSDATPSENEPGVIFRYRAATDVLRAVGEEKSFSANEKEISGKIIGITCSADDGTGSEYAWKLAKKLSEHGSVLFIGLSALFRSGEVRNSACENAVSELFYRLNRDEELITEDLAVRTDGVDAITGYAFWADADELSSAGIERLISFLSECKYDKVVLDLCSLRSFTVPVLFSCDRVIFKGNSGPFGEARFSEMKRQLAFAGYGDLLVKMEEA